MKLELSSLALILSLANAFVIPQQGTKAPTTTTTTALNDKVNSMWAFDVYGRDDGELPSLEIMYAEGDPWYFNARSGLSQSDFYPTSHAGNRLQTSTSTSAVPPPQAPVAAADPPAETAAQQQAPPLPAGEESAPVPEMEMPKVESSQANV
ncbi:unnamed protein product [Cylindrotheca closterium]|uniref:Uncharacterized protein n=1 Tax=Cylindrotheca closterium TaxID=2856 RepID=A0AAD2FSF2_9STRA|nr:unnamed protein product [Cylindrotheca closterium]